MIQLSHPYMTTGKTVTVTTQTFAGKVMSLLFNTLSSFVVAFLPRSRYLLFHGYSPIYSAYLLSKHGSFSLDKTPKYYGEWMDVCKVIKSRKTKNALPYLHIGLLMDLYIYIYFFDKIEEAFPS